MVYLRRECERLFERSVVVLFKEAHGTLLDVTLKPASHECFDSSGNLRPEEASSIGGGVIIVVSRRSLAMTMWRHVVEVSRGRILQLDLGFCAGGMHITSIHINTAWTMVALRVVVSEVRRRSSVAGRMPAFLEETSTCLRATRYATQRRARLAGARRRCKERSCRSGPRAHA